MKCEKDGYTCEILKEYRKLLMKYDNMKIENAMLKAQINWQITVNQTQEHLSQYLRQFN